MGNEEIKKANRKALPKFILLCIVGALIGGVAGYLVGANGIDTMSGDFKVVVSNYVELTAPWIMLAIAVIIPIVLVPYYRKAKKQLSQWDGEDEEVSDGVEGTLSPFNLKDNKNVMANPTTKSSMLNPNAYNIFLKILSSNSVR